MKKFFKIEYENMKIVDLKKNNKVSDINPSSKKQDSKDSSSVNYEVDMNEPGEYNIII